MKTLLRKWDIEVGVGLNRALTADVFVHLRMLDCQYATTHASREILKLVYLLDFLWRSVFRESFYT